MSRLTIIFLLSFLAVLNKSSAFVQPTSFGVLKTSPIIDNLVSIDAKKKSEYDFSSIESRDLTREEMLDINKQNEEIMNMELSMMTGFSLVLSLPILYLCWVAFYSD